MAGGRILFSGYGTLTGAAMERPSPETGHTLWILRYAAWSSLFQLCDCNQPLLAIQNL